MLKPQIQTLLEKLDAIAAQFYSLLELETADLAIPPVLRGSAFDFYYPFRNSSTEANKQIYTYFHYDGTQIVQQTTVLSGMGQAAARTFAFLIQNAVLHPRIADYILQNSPHPLETIADMKAAIALLFGKKGLQIFSRALRIHRLFLSQVILRSRLIDTTDGFVLLEERVARPDFDAFLQFVVQIRIAYYLHNFMVAQASKPERCPFHHDLLAATPSILPVVLDVRAETPIHQTILDTLDEFELSENRERTQWAFMESLSSGAFLLEDAFYEQYSHVSPLKKFMVVDHKTRTSYRIAPDGTLLFHSYDPKTQRPHSSLLPSTSRVQTISKDGQTFIFPMIGHCPELIWGDLAVRPNFQLAPHDIERIQNFDRQWLDDSRRVRRKTRDKNIRI